MKKVFLILATIVMFFVCGCEQNDIEDNLSKKEKQLLALKHKYGLENVKVIDRIGVPSDKIYSIEEAEHILEKLKGLKGKKFPIKLEKSFQARSYNYGGQATVIGHNQELSAAVFLDLTRREVVGS